jgi:hypothetical protein
VTDRLRRAFSELLNWLNGIGSILLVYALANPTAASDLMNQLPEKFKTPVALAAPAAWFCVVQFAKVRALKRGPGNAP